jgi:hypothetical protein
VCPPCVLADEPYDKVEIAEEERTLGFDAVMLRYERVGSRFDALEQIGRFFWSAAQSYRLLTGLCNSAAKSSLPNNAEL